MYIDAGNIEQERNREFYSSHTQNFQQKIYNRDEPARNELAKSWQFFFFAESAHSTKYIFKTTQKCYLKLV